MVLTTLPFCFHTLFIINTQHKKYPYATPTQLFGMEAEPSFDATPLASGNSPVMSPDPPSVEPKKVISLSTSPRGLNNDSDTGWDDDDLDNLFE